MPESPKWQRPYWMPKPERKETEESKEKKKRYKKQKWVKYRSNYIKNVAKGICEVDKAIGKYTDITGKGEAVLDHIVRVEAGGSFYDSRNHMLMKDYWHNKKRQLEGIKSILVETIEIENEHGERELIPKNRNEIIKVLTNEKVEV